MKKISLAIAALLLLSSCSFFGGKKQDDTVDEIFEQGRIDPNLIPANIGYVPVLPFFSGFLNPVDVYVGYDEMIYVVDDNGVHVLDQAGREFRLLAIPGASELIQDRRLHTYVIGKATVVDGGQNYEVSAVYHLSNTATAEGPFFLDTLVQPFCDASREFTSFRGAAEEQVLFTGLAVLHDNTLMVSRQGPQNSSASVAYPDNTILFFDKDGKNTGNSNGLNAQNPSIRSSYKVVGMAVEAGPPQRLFGMSQSRDFWIAQYDATNPVEFACLGIAYQFDPDLGASFDAKPQLLNFDSSKAGRFLYESFRFGKIEDIYMAPDNTGYLFVVDSDKDSLFQFTNLGFEGVTPPANFNSKKQVIASFGGEGSGPFQFRDPSGVCYFKQRLFIADKGNGRICRYILSTDLE